jgi:predicted metal-dependent phosphoesterase TrpH
MIAPESCYVDLHAHTTASDGAATPRELVDAARRAGLAVVAITDHDTVQGVAEARDAAVVSGMTVWAGVELSAVEESLEVHVLGLSLAEPARIESTLVGLRTARHARAEAMVGALNALGIPMTMDGVMREAGDGSVGRPHVARALIAGGWVADVREAFDRYLGTARPAFVPKAKLSVERAIAMIHEAGGVAAWAHPGREGTLERVRRWEAAGMDGLEVLHPGHSGEDVARLRSLADHVGLLPTGGSDWHGAREGPRTLGAMRVPAEWGERIAERSERYRAPDHPPLARPVGAA